MVDTLRILLPLYAVLLFLLLPFAWFYRSRFRNRGARARFLKGVLAIFRSSDNIQDCAAQASMLYKRLSENYTSLDQTYRSPAEMLEDLIVNMDTSTPGYFKEGLGIEPPVKYRQRMMQLLEALNALQPYSSLSSKQGNLLNMLNQAINTRNRALGLSTLGQLGDELEVVENTIRRQKSINQLSFVVSVIGVILTFFFGFISFVQFLSR